LSEKETFYYTATVHSMHNKGGGMRFGMGVQNNRGSRGPGRESPSRVQGRSPSSGSGEQSPPEAEEF